MRENIGMNDIKDFIKRARTGGQLSVGEQSALQLTRTDYEVYFRSRNIPVLTTPNDKEYPMIQYIIGDESFLGSFVDPSVMLIVELTFQDLLGRFLDRGKLPIEIVEHRKLQEKMRGEDDVVIERLISERGMRL